MTSRSGVASRLSTACLAFAVVMEPGLARAQDPFGTASLEQVTPATSTQRAPGDPSDWDIADPVPLGYHVENRIRRNVVVRGGGLLLLAYVFSAFAAASSLHEAPLWIPVAGPFIQIGQTSNSNAPGMILLAGDGLFQAVGAGMIVYGIAAPAHVLVRDVGPARVSLVPLSLGNGSHGFGIVGTF